MRLYRPALIAILAPPASTQPARLLNPLGISPGTVRRGSLTNKGYVRSQFEKAWRTYL